MNELPPIKALRIAGQPLFSGGELRASHGIAIAFMQDPKTLHPFLDRHFCGDWGDLSDDDKQANEDALFDGSRIFSAYQVPACHERERGPVKIWIITDAQDDDGNRENTCVLYPSEY